MTDELFTPPLFELLTSPDVDGEHEGRARFDVRSFMATEAISTLFQIRITAHHVEPGLDFLEIVGAPASFRATGHGGGGEPITRTWSGIISSMEQTRAVGGSRSYSTYELTLVPRLWLLTQRRNYRIFQYKSELAIALEVLAEWEIPVVVRLDPAIYRARKYKVQYAETDYEFLYRVLSEVGVCFFFEYVDDEQVIVLADAPHLAPPLEGALGYQDTPNQADGETFVTSLRRSQRVRPNAILLRDRDYRKDSSYELQAGAHVVDAQKRELAVFDRRLEGFYYPENFNFLDEGVDETTPTADARGLSRTDEVEAKRLALIDLGSRRNDSYVIEFDSNDLRLTHGVVFAVEGHPADEINHKSGFLVVESRIAGRVDSALAVSCEAVSARWVYRATLAAKPRIIGVESATVVGAHGEEIDCDEFGRVKVHFHWDRYSKRNEESSCWIPVSQTWGGAGMGGVQIPRIGQEVLVEFLAGDPDRPIVTGRVFTAVNKVPIKLPQAKTQTILQSQSTGGGGGHNMLRMEDAAGNEHLHMRAEKDRSAQVNNNCSTHVGANRSTRVGANESKTIKGNQTTRIGGTQTTTVKGDVMVTTESNQGITTKQSYWCETTEGGQTFASKAGFHMQTDGQFMLQCPAEAPTATIMITPGAIVIDAPKVLINPGPLFMAAVRSGKSIEDAIEETRPRSEQEKELDAYIEKMMNTPEVKAMSEEDQKRVRDRLLGEKKRVIGRQEAGKNTVGQAEGTEIFAPITGEDGIFSTVFGKNKAAQRASALHDLQAQYAESVYGNGGDYTKTNVKTAIALAPFFGHSGATKAAELWRKNGYNVPDPPP